MSRPSGRVRVLSRQVEHAPDPLALFRALSEGGRRRDVCLFESADAPESGPSKSLIVCGAALRAVCRGLDVEIRALGSNGANALEVVGSALSVAPENGVLRASFERPPLVVDSLERLRARSPLDVLRAMSTGLDVEAGAPRRTPLAVGIFAYDLVGAFEVLPDAVADPLGFPDYTFLLGETQIEIDHAARRTVVSSAVFDGPDTDRIQDEAARRIGELALLCRNVRPEPVWSGALRPATEVSVDLDDAAYADVVRRMIEHVRAGDVFQVVPSRTFSAPCPDPLAAYAVLRELNPSPYMFYMSTGEQVLFGASPETALRVTNAGDGKRRVEVRPIAGTRPRGRSADGFVEPDLDDRLKAELLLDRKELAEHMMLVDLARNDIAQVAVPGTRRVEELLAVEPYSHVTHLVSRVTGILREDLDALHAYRAAMNAGTLVGAPKLRAAELLRRYETTRRGPYGGAVGYLTPDGELDSAIVIRSALVANGVAHVRAGAGVVAESVPEREAEETRHKADAVLQALAIAAQRSLQEVTP